MFSLFDETSYKIILCSRYPNFMELSTYKISSCFHHLMQARSQGGGGARGALPPKKVVKIVKFFKIHAEIGKISDFAPPPNTNFWLRACVKYLTY